MKRKIRSAFLANILIESGRENMNIWVDNSIAFKGTKLLLEDSRSVWTIVDILERYPRKMVLDSEVNVKLL